MRQVLGAGWYRLRATLGQLRAGYLSVVLLVGLIGGAAMTSAEAARRTQSSYPAFLASTNPSDLAVTLYGPTGGPVAPLTARLRRLPEVRSVRAVAEPTNFLPLGADGAPRRVSALAQVLPLSSLDGEFFDQDRPGISEGRMVTAGRADEMVLSARAAAIFGAHVGEVVPIGLYTPAQEALPRFGTPAVPPRLLVDVKVVGIAVFNTQVVQDDIDGAYGFVLLSPALLRQAAALWPPVADPYTYELQLRRPANEVPPVERAIARLAPPGADVQFHVTSRVVTEVELALKPESAALGGFGAIALLVCLVVGAQAISRQLRLGDEDRVVMRALGATPLLTFGDGLVGLLGSVVLGALVAAGTAVAMSPLFPLGPVGPVYPDRGVGWDWTVLGLGMALIVVGLGGVAAALCYYRAPHRTGARRQGAARSSVVARTAEVAGLPVATVAGVRFALEPGRGATSVPVRSALVGTVIAVAVVVGTLTFASSLQTLVSHPALYGWNWDYALEPSNAMPPQSLALLDHDRAVAAWSGFDYNTVELDGQAVPALLARATREEVSPPILSGHGLTAADQVVMGASTLAALHEHVGGTVDLSYGTPADGAGYLPATPLRVVGTATFPTVGFLSLVDDHTSMGTGAMFSEAVFPPAFRSAVIDSTDPDLSGPELVFVRVRAGVGPAAGRANLQHVAQAADQVFAADTNVQAHGNIVDVLGVQRPAQIVNYRTVGATPVILASGLAAGAVLALGLILTASVRRRHRELALLKALGFTQRQVWAAIAWQSTVAAVVGVAVGVPVGIVAGRQLWALFARSIDAVPDPTVPAGLVLLVALGALAFANLVAAHPARAAARTPTALVLRAE